MFKINKYLLILVSFYLKKLRFFFIISKPYIINHGSCSMYIHMEKILTYVYLLSKKLRGI